VAIITPFNFPLEIPALQLMGALFMGNKPLLHVDRRCVSLASTATLNVVDPACESFQCRQTLHRQPIN